MLELMKPCICFFRLAFALAAIAVTVACFLPVLRKDGPFFLPRCRIVALCVVLALLTGFVLFIYPVACQKLFPSRYLKYMGCDGIMEMDVNRVSGTLTGFRGNYRTKVHPLQSLLYNPFGTEVNKRFGYDRIVSAQVICFACQLLAATLLAAIVWISTASRLCVATGVLLYLSTYGFWISSFIPESAPLAAPTVLLPYLVLSIAEKRRRQGKAEHSAFIAAGLWSLSVTTTNVAHGISAFANRCVMRGMRGTRLCRSVLTYILIVGAIGAALSYVQFVVYPGSNLWFIRSSVSEESSFIHARSLLSPTAWWDTIQQMFLYTIIGPAHLVVRNAGNMPQIGVERLHILQCGLLYGALALFVSVTLVWSVARIRGMWLGKAVIAGLLFNLCLHVVYGNNYIMYSGNWLPLLPLIVAIAIGRSRYRRRYLHFLILPLLAFTSWLGITSLSSTVSSHAKLTDTRYFVGTPLRDELAYAVVGFDGAVSPGIGTYGVRFSALDEDSGQSNLNQLVSMSATRELVRGYLPFPIIRTTAGDYGIEQTVFPGRGKTCIIRLTINTLNKKSSGRVRISMALTNAGPAGAPPGRPRVFGRKPNTEHFYVNDKLAVVGEQAPNAAYGHGTDHLVAHWNLQVTSNRPYTMYFVCFVPRSTSTILSRPGECVDPLDWAGNESIAALSPGFAARAVDAAQRHWSEVLSGFRVDCPDPEWECAMKACALEIALNVQEDGELVVSPVNYPAFTRDAMYATNVLLMTAQYELAKKSIDYLLKDPWAGRPYAEGDAPGQLLWLMGQYWRFTGDHYWLRQHRSDISQLVRAVRQTRSRGTGIKTVDLLGNHGYLTPNSALADTANYKLLNYGTMDGCGTIYCNLFAVAGLSRATEMLEALKMGSEAERVRRAVQEYSGMLNALVISVGGYQADGRGHYCALWPCRYHELSSNALRQYAEQEQASGKAKSSFGLKATLKKAYKAAQAAGWFSEELRYPYFELDRAHNMLVAGDNVRADAAVEKYLSNQLMRTWRTLDEGGASSPGYWALLNRGKSYSGDGTVAMPHCWSLASLFSLMRDCIAREDSGRLILMSGVPTRWYRPGSRMSFRMPTEYGILDLRVAVEREHIHVTIESGLNAPKGCWLSLPNHKGPTKLIRLDLASDKGIKPMSYVVMWK